MDNDNVARGDSTQTSARDTSEAQAQATHFLKQLRAQARPGLRLVNLAVILATLATVAFSLTVTLVVSAALQSQTPALWLWWLGALAIVVRLAANLWRDRLAQALSARIRMQMRAQLVDDASRMGPHRLAVRGNTVWWANQVLEQVDALHGYIARYLPARQMALITPVTIIAITFSVDWLAGLLLLLATPIIPVFMVLIGWGTDAVHRKQQEQQASLAAHLMDRLQALPWLRRVGALQVTQDSVETAAQDYRRMSMRVLRVAFLSSAALEFFSAVSIGLMAIYIGFALLGLIGFGPAGAMTLAAGLFILMLAPECFLPLRQLAQAHHDMNAARASANVLCEVNALFTREQPSATNTITADDDPRVAVRLTDVTLQWADASEPLLQRVNLTLERGQLLGLAGDSGQGKSTLVHLMAGLISPSAGQLRRDPNWAWLGQQPHLFHSSLRDNLTLARQEPIDDDTLKSALAQVGLALPNEELPHGLDTTIGETNRGVSGGQAQRIALARALLSGATIWLLDEPTAALDDATRDALWQAVVNNARAHGVTVVVASHDPVVLAHCDRVI
jgi:ATP-binding cassette subfamily C protein CydD